MQPKTGIWLYKSAHELCFLSSVRRESSAVKVAMERNVKRLATKADKNMLASVSSALCNRSPSRRQKELKRRMAQAATLYSNRRRTFTVPLGTDDPVPKFVDRPTAVEFCRPLMDHCVTVKDENPWLDIRCHLLSFHEDNLRAGLEDGVELANRLDNSKLSAKFYYIGAPPWLVQMGTRLHEVTQTDEALTAKMEKALTGEDTSEPFEDICRQRRENMVLMNNYVSCISLYIGLCEKIPPWGFDDHPHFKAIAEYFKTNHLDHAGLERICQVLDLAVCTSRRMNEYREDRCPHSEEGKEGLALSYLFDEEGAKIASCHDDTITAEFLEWFDEVLVKLKKCGKECTQDMFEQISTSLKRVECERRKVCDSLMALAEWRNDCVPN